MALDTVSLGATRAELPARPETEAVGEVVSPAERLLMATARLSEDVTEAWEAVREAEATGLIHSDLARWVLDAAAWSRRLTVTIGQVIVK